jgi:hypothetical protein
MGTSSRPTGSRFLGLFLTVPLVLAACPKWCPDGEEPEPLAQACTAGDAVRVDRVASELPSRVLAVYHASIPGQCRWDSTCVGPVPLTLAPLPPGGCAPAELAAFSPGSDAGAAPDCPGQAGDDQRCGGRQELSLQAPDAVAVALWVVAPKDELPEELVLVAHEFEHANGAFARAGAGVVVRYAVTGLASDVQADSARIAHIGEGCGSAPSVRSDGTVFTPGAVNIYYLSRPSDGTLDAGGSCPPPYADAAYVDLSQRRPALLAHELGHSLGLVTPGYAQGNVEGLPDYAAHTADPEFRDNLMNGSVVTVENVWAGQIYRLHFDAQRAWLQLHPTTTAPTFGHPCQDSETAEGPCPALTLRIRSWQ